MITEESQIEQVEIFTQRSDGSVEVSPEISQVAACDSECANLITPPRIYIQTSFSGGGDQDLSHEDVVEEIAQALQLCESFTDFVTVAQEYELSQVEEAIALQQTHPRRRQLRAWFEAGVPPASERPPLTAYQPGDEVWAYFPQSQDKWLKASVEWVRSNLIRVKSGFFGMLIEKAELIAPGHWELTI